MSHQLTRSRGELQQGDPHHGAHVQSVEVDEVPRRRHQVASGLAHGIGRAARRRFRALMARAGRGSWPCRRSRSRMRLTVDTERGALSRRRRRASFSLPQRGWVPRGCRTATSSASAHSAGAAAADGSFGPPATPNGTGRSGAASDGPPGSPRGGSARRARRGSRSEGSSSVAHAGVSVVDGADARIPAPLAIPIPAGEPAFRARPPFGTSVSSLTSASMTASASTRTHSRRKSVSPQHLPCAAARARPSCHWQSWLPSLSSAATPTTRG